MTNLEVTLNPEGNTPLAALCRFGLEAPKGSKLQVVADSDGFQLHPEAGERELVILGLLPSTTYMVWLEAQDGTVLSNEVSLVTPALPAGLPLMEIRRNTPGLREPGFLLFALGKNPKAIQKYTDFECVMALDRMGRVVWLYLSDVSIMGVEVTDHGTLVLMTTDGRILEITWLGHVIHEWFNPAEHASTRPGAIAVDTAKFHHATCALPDGWRAALSVEFREVDGFPYPAQALDGVSKRQRVAGDTIVEFHPETGEIRRQISLLDVLDPCRVGHHVMGPFWDNQGYPGCRDWSHQNSLIYDPQGDAYLTTLRHQDACCKIGRVGDLKWLIAPPEHWGEKWANKRLHGLQGWAYHPHDPTVLDNGDILLFDNGTARATPPDPPMPIETAYSRVVRYRIDELQRTVSEVWSIGGPDGLLPYAAYLSGARELPLTRNIAITCGGILLTKGGERTDVPPEGIGSACILEYTQTNPPVCLFELWFHRSNEEDLKGWSIFRSAHLRELYRDPSRVTRNPV